MSHGSSRVLRLDALARVEGEGAVRLRLKGREVVTAELRLYEPPRFFEAFLVGRGHTEPPDLTARICGICPVAYQMTACQAVEAACGTTVDGQLARLRRLLYYGEWIESQSLHVHLLHAPDFLGCADAVEVARGHRTAVERGLRIKQAGNAVVEVLGGRPIHPVNVRVGGFHRAPSRAELGPLAERLRRARDEALEAVGWVAGFDFPEASFDGEFLALHDPGGYAIDSGGPAVLPPVGSPGGPRSLPVEEFERRVVEEQVPYSTALQSRLDGRPYLTGPLARYALNGRWLHPAAAEAARGAGLGDPTAGDPCRNPYRSIVVRAVEVVHALEEALLIIERYRPPERPYVEVPAREAVGCAATEAPRGLLYHRYALGPDGTVTRARIVPPTAQNQAAIEEDLRSQVGARLARSPAAVGDGELAALCERAVRNHDPCISCATHFLDLSVERE
ncbi:nickel-dependent hydrogenase large subunit [Kitasatospora sp. NPDC093679]|uniref:Ni/Fe hydrogenase subunit alpha n=1 Tax=Kitasatospora sp. NPDC093679 TaxID=3154983 RepID=UPI0034447D4F